MKSCHVIKVMIVQSDLRFLSFSLLIPMDVQLLQNILPYNQATQDADNLHAVAKISINYSIPHQIPLTPSLQHNTTPSSHPKVPPHPYSSSHSSHSPPASTLPQQHH